jgi:hypothetical protein
MILLVVPWIGVGIAVFLHLFKFEPVRVVRRRANRSG